MMQQSETSKPNNSNEAHHGAEEDAIVEKFDSLDLDVDLTDLNINLTQNLSASLFDSAPSITDTTYQDTPTSSEQPQWIQNTFLKVFFMLVCNWLLKTFSIVFVQFIYLKLNCKQSY